jgi:hypothetical protein
MNCNPDQRELLGPIASSPRDGKLIPFPLARRSRKVAIAARTFYGRRTERGRQRFWSRTIEDLARELRRHGADQSTIDRELEAFRQAVSAELERRES